MTELLTAAQMRAIEKAAIDSGEVTGLELMERAGVGVVEAILEEWPEMATASQKAVVLCGPGNNGGDGFVVARLLKERSWEVEVFLYGELEKLPPDAKVNAERWLEVGAVAPFSQIYNSTFLTRPLVVDAVFGTGLSRKVPDEVKRRLLASLDCRSVSIDVASILQSDTGKTLTQWPHDMSLSNITVTFERAKRGHYMGTGGQLSKRIYIKKIGLSVWQREQIAKKFSTGQLNDFLFLFEPTQPELAVLTKTLPHKFGNGSALILSGPSGKTGAARLAARGALRIGAGVVTVACPPEALDENAAQLNAIMISPVADATALKAVLQDERINALCLGPALGLDQHARDLVEVVLTGGGHGGVKPRPTVLDADAISLLAQDSDLFEMLYENVVLTPHAGEFARLFPDIAAKLAEPATKGPAYSKVDATRDAAKRAGCVVLYKGADTVIADASGRAAINSAHYERAAPWLATAGSGDVLAGFITGLLARGFSPMQAAETGAWLHVECALKFGPGLIAEDIAEQLPKVFAELGL